MSLSKRHLSKLQPRTVDFNIAFGLGDAQKRKFDFLRSQVFLYITRMV